MVGVRRPGEEREHVFGTGGQRDLERRRCCPLGLRMERGYRVRRAHRRIAGVADGRRHRAIIGDRVVVDGAFVEAQVDQPHAIGRPGVGRLGRAGRQLLVVHPVQAAVEDRLAPVGRQALNFAVGKGQDVQVVVLHVRDGFAIGREHLPGHAAGVLDDRCELARAHVEQPQRLVARQEHFVSVRRPLRRGHVDVAGALGRIEEHLLVPTGRVVEPQHVLPILRLNVRQCCSGRAPVEARRAGPDQGVRRGGARVRSERQRSAPAVRIPIRARLTKRPLLPARRASVERRRRPQTETERETG